MQINKYKNLGSGWHNDNIRHHNAKVFGIAGGLYAKQLPIYKIGNKFYFRDVRLGEYRDVINPHNKLSINTDNSKLQKSSWKEFQDYVANKKNYIKGGIGDKTDISKLNQEELKKGIKVELEHTSNPKIAREIASDHLTEYKDYYKELSIMEKKLKVINEDKRPYFIKEPYGIPFELTETGKYRTFKEPTKFQLTENAIRDMFLSKQYNGKVPVKDINIIMKKSKNWERIYGKNNFKKAFVGLGKEGHYKKKGNFYVWGSYWGSE